MSPLYSAFRECIYFHVTVGGFGVVALSGGCTSAGLWLHKVGGFLFVSSGFKGYLSLYWASYSTGCAVVAGAYRNENQETAKQHRTETVEIIE